VPRRGVQAIALGTQARGALVPIVAALRRVLGEPAYADYEERKLLAHLKIADRNRARFALILGSEELAAGVIVLRDLEGRTDRRLPLGSAKDVAAAFVEASNT
jgi:histidyl-tRNA synthetase